MYSRFEGMIPYLPTKPQAEALLIEKEKELKRAEEKRRSFQALQDDFRNYLSKYNPQALNQHSPPRDCSPSSPIIQTTPVQPTKPPEPPDLKQSDPIPATKPNHTPKRSTKKFSQRYSCEEVYERMENGLCLFCDEQDTPDHYRLKHKRSQIFMIEYDDDQVSSDKELDLAELAVKEGNDASTSHGEDLIKLNDVAIEIEVPIEEKESSGVKNLIVTATAQDKESRLENDSRPVQVLHQMEVSPYAQILKDIKTHHAAHQVFDTMRLRVHKESSKEAVTVLGTHLQILNTSVGISCSGQANHVWKPGGLLCVQYPWDWFRRLHCKGRVLNLVNDEFKVHVSSSVDMKEWIGLERYNREHKKQMTLPVYQGLEVQKWFCLHEFCALARTGWSNKDLFGERETIKKIMGLYLMARIERVRKCSGIMDDAENRGLMVIEEWGIKHKNDKKLLAAMENLYREFEHDFITPRLLEEIIKGDTSIFLPQQVCPKLTTALHGRETSHTASHVWHRWKNKAEKWQAVSGLMMLRLVRFQTATREGLWIFVCGAILIGLQQHGTVMVLCLLLQNFSKSMVDYVSVMFWFVPRGCFKKISKHYHRSKLLDAGQKMQPRLIYDEEKHRRKKIKCEMRMRKYEKLQRASKYVMCEQNIFNKICRLRKVGRCVMCDVSFWDNLYLVNSYEMFHSPRPPEFAFNKAASNSCILEDKDALKKGVLLQEESVLKLIIRFVPVIYLNLVGLV